MFVHLKIKIRETIYYKLYYPQLVHFCQYMHYLQNSGVSLLTFFNWPPDSLSWEVGRSASSYIDYCGLFSCRTSGHLIVAFNMYNLITKLASNQLIFYQKFINCKLIKHSLLRELAGHLRIQNLVNIVMNAPLPSCPGVNLCMIILLN